MAHQCVHCGKLYENAAPELLTGCSCKSKFFFFIKQEQYDKLKQDNVTDVVIDFKDKAQVEKDVREMIGAVDEDRPVILDLESIKVSGPGKFEIDVVSLFNKKRPLIYKLEEGKYVIDLASTLKADMDEIHKKIKNPKK